MILPREEQLIAVSSNSENDPQSTVTLTGTSAAGRIAPGGSKDFYIYLPTFDPVSPATTVELSVKVNIFDDGPCLVSYTREVSLMKVQRNVINNYNFLIIPTLRHPESYYFFNVGTEGSPVYVDFAKHNEGANDQLGMGDLYTTPGSWNVLTPNQWANLFSNTDNGLAKVGNQYGWVFLRDGFVKPFDCDNPTALGRGTRTITINDNFTQLLTVTSYTSTQWTSMEDSGAVFIPLSGAFPETPIKDQVVQQYTYYYVPDFKKEKNMYFYFDCKYGEQNKVVKLKQFSIKAGTNLNQNVSGYYVRQVL